MEKQTSHRNYGGSTNTNIYSVSRDDKFFEKKKRINPFQRNWNNEKTLEHVSAFLHKYKLEFADE